MAVHVDITSLYSLAMALTLEKVPLWSEWSYSDVATVSLRTNFLRVPPPPAEKLRPKNLLEPLIKESIKSRIDPGAISKATRMYAKDVDKRIGSITTIFKRLYETDESKAWVEWHIDNEWAERFHRLDGIVHHSNIERVALVSGIENQEIIALNKACITFAENNREKVREEFSAKDIENLSKLWVAEVLIRGVYYEFLAQECESKWILHPARRAVATYQRVGSIVHSSWVTATLAAMIGNLARREKAEARIKAWFVMIKKVRETLKAIEDNKSEKNELTNADSSCESAESFSARLLRDLDFLPRLGRLRQSSGVFSHLIGEGVSIVTSPILVAQGCPYEPTKSLVRIVAAESSSRLLHCGIEYVESRELNIRRLGKKRAGRVFSSTEVFKATHP